MSRKPKLAAAESEVMNTIWHFNKPVTVRDVLKHLYPAGEKAYTTIQTIMNILSDKGFLRKEKIGMVNFYQPTVSKEDFAKQETRNFVSRLFDGSFGALANHLVDSGNLSRDELEKLRHLIESKTEGGREGDD